MNKKNTGAPNRVRIIGGDWRSRVLQFASLPELRPTPDRVRETLFNWLQVPILGARCLDLFAGSGALGFEALSRGAASVTALETDGRAAALIRDNAGLLKTTRMEVVQRSAPDWLASNPQGQHFDVVFVDPPFTADLHEPCLALLASRHWLAPGALVYLEWNQDLGQLALPEKWVLTRHKRAGAVHFGLCVTPDQKAGSEEG